MNSIKQKTIVISGASGFIGRLASRYLLEQGYYVIGLSRTPFATGREGESNSEIRYWNPSNLDGWETVLHQADVIINLAGENISALRWTNKKKDRIMNSRVQSAKIFSKAHESNIHKPNLFIQVSGIHYYGSHSEGVIDETTAGGSGFLAQVAQTVEAATKGIQSSGIRRVILRMGMVLAAGAGALPKLLRPYKFFVGGPIGNGRQWIPWVHYIDLCRVLDFFITQPQLQGPFNLVSPLPVQNCEMAKIIGKALGKPSFFPTPGWIIKLLMGEMGRELLLTSQRVIPKSLLKSGFEFKYPELAAALDNLLREP